MPVPKSVVKFKGKGVEYTSSVDFASYTIVELTRAALRDVGKFLTRETNRKAMKLKGLGKNNRVRGKKSAFLYVVPWAKKGLPHLEVGITDSTWYGVEQEMGTHRQPKREFLKKSAYENLVTIVEIESQYLSKLKDEAVALRAIKEKEYSGGEDSE